MKAIDYRKYEGHTPGRWSAGENTVAGVRHYGVGIDESHKMVALTGWVGADDAHESIANACLIADAPDLLAACRERDEEIARLRDALAETLDRIVQFRVWFEDEYMEHVEVDDPLLTEVARLGLNGRAEAALSETEEVR